MNEHTAYVILNPIAGHSDRATIEEALARSFDDAGWSYEIYRLTDHESVPDVVRSALGQGYDLFIAAGGDGTISAVAAGLANSGKPLGILPVGTTNVLARELGIPLQLNDAIALLMGKHRQQNVDALQIGEQYFLVGMSAGILPRIMRDTHTDEKRRLGLLAYLWTGIKQLASRNARTFELSIDGQEDRLCATEIVVANSATFETAMTRFGLRSSSAEGRMGVYALRTLALLGLLSLLWQRLMGRSGTRSPIRHWTAEQHVEIRTDPPVDVQGDGEVLGQTPVDVRLAPGAVVLLVPTEE